MIIVLFGQPCSGKTTLANQIEADYHIDGDHLRNMFKNKDYSRQGRINNLNRASDIATYLHYNGNRVVLSLVYPYKEARDYLNSLVSDIFWIYLTYRGERGRETNHVKDFDLPHRDDLNITIDTSATSEENSLQLIKKFINEKHIS